MTKPAHKVAILHRDGEIVARVTRVAALAGLEILRPASLAAMTRHVNDPLLSAIVTELPAPRDGGIDSLNGLHSSSAHPAIVILTDADQKTVENAKQMAAAKGLDIAIFQKIDDIELTRRLCSGRDSAPHFGHAEIDDCIENRNFRVEYQPKVSLLSSSPESQFGVEALCRMTDPKFGAISPDKFIPMAEKSGLIAKLTDAVVCDAFKAWRSWKAAGLSLRLALNVSPVLLGDNEWSEKFLQRCAEFGMEPKWVTLEITETAAGATSPKACEILTNLQKKGFALSIDDFGTGFSSLASLYRLPIAEMKIDKSFILDLQGTAGARNLVESAIAMAKRMGIKVVAEGVETESVFEELRKIGCHEVQGFFVGRSMPADAIVPFFTGWRKTMPGAPGAPKGLPKIAIVQALLNDIVNDSSLEATPAPVVGPYGGGPVRTAEAKDQPKDLVRKIPPLILEGKTIQALALCHATIRQLQSLHGYTEMRAKLGQLQTHLEEELTTSANLEIYSPQGMFRFLPRDAVNLGRPSTAARVDIPIKCRWFSLGEKNLRLFTKSGKWFLEDLGSSHGHYIAETKLVARRPFELPLGNTLVEVRLASGAVAPLALLFRRTPINPDAIAISFDYDIQSLRANLGEKDWSELEGDLTCTWIVFNGNFNVGSSENCAWMLDDCTWSMAGTIRFDKGFWISPAADRTIAMDNTVFHQDVPLPAKSELNVGGSLLVVREITDESAARAPSKTVQSHVFAYKARQA